MILIVIAGFVVGRFAAVWAASLIDPSIHTGLRSCMSCNRRFTLLRQLLVIVVPVKCHDCKQLDSWWPVKASIVTAVAFGLFAWLLQHGSQTVIEVRPSMELWQNRLPFHLVFIFLLITATIADLLDYVIPDSIVVPGILFALTFATLTGELQIIHLWVDWDYDFVTLYAMNAKYVLHPRHRRPFR